MVTLSSDVLRRTKNLPLDHEELQMTNCLRVVMLACAFWAGQAAGDEMSELSQVLPLPFESESQFGTEPIDTGLLNKTVAR